MIHDTDEYPKHWNQPPQKPRIEEREWDCLIVLDACRWDALHDEIGSEVEKVSTPARASTPDWLSKVWDQSGWEDVTYISANPFSEYVYEMQDYSFQMENRVNHVKAWEECMVNEIGVTPPGRLTTHAQQFSPPMVVHYMQPHTPFIGNIQLNVRYTEEMNAVVPEKAETRATDPFYRLVETGHISAELCREAYRENLRLALDSVERLFGYKGTTIVTADHGEALGPREWSHGSGDDPRARVVPWWVAHE